MTKAEKVNGEHGVILERLKVLDEKVTEIAKTTSRTHDTVIAMQPERKTIMQELWPEGRSRIQTVEANVQSCDEKLHAFIATIKEDSGVGVSRRWAVTALIIGAFLTLCVSVIAQVILREVLSGGR